MKTLKYLLIMLFLMSGSVYCWAQNSIINSLSVIDSSNNSILLGRQSIVEDQGTFYLFYTLMNTSVDYLIMRSTTDNGATWTDPDTISVHVHSTTARYHLNNPTVTLDDQHYFHVLCKYTGEPLYASGYSSYPPNHMNYITNTSGNWTTRVNVINDSLVQTNQGNGTTVSYLNNNQIVHYQNHQFFVSDDYAWWATKYNIVYSDNLSGVWHKGDTLHTYNLGEYDNIMLMAPSLVVNNDSLFALWYQRKDCRVEMKAYTGSDWSPLRIVYNDVVYPAPKPTSYTVRVGSCFDDNEARIAMFRAPATDFNELLLLTKSKGLNWAADTLMLPHVYSIVNPSIMQDTTYVFLVWSNDTNNQSLLVKYTNDQAFVSQSTLATGTGEVKFYNLQVSERSVNPIIYITYDTDKSKYFLNAGKINGLTTAIHSLSADIEPGIRLWQNHPNPFRSSTNITYSIDRPGNVSIEVYNVLGKKMHTLVNAFHKQGKYSVSFDATQFKQGLYFYKIEALGYSITKKMLLVH